MNPRLQAAAAQARGWLLGEMLPLWTTAGFDAAAGQFVEALSVEGEPLGAPRRTLVQARQMAVCCVAGRLGWDGPWAERAARAGETLLARGRTPDGDWIYSFAASGGVGDVRTDLYTQAFAIFGLAEAGRGLERTDFVAAARETKARLEQAWRDPGGGYLEGEIAPHPGRQNPHMHLLEAALALHRATGDAADLAWADALGALFEGRMLQQPAAIPEAFDASWRPIVTEGLAPGHQMEWGYLLDQLGRSGGRDRAEIALALMAHGEWLGVDAAGFAVDLVALDGAPRQATARLWPQAERLRAALCRRGREERADADAEAAVSALFTYLDTPTRGAWRDLRLAGGGWAAGASPASSGYHIAGALEALIAAVG